MFEVIHGAGAGGNEDISGGVALQLVGQGNGAAPVEGDVNVVGAFVFMSQLREDVSEAGGGVNEDSPLFSLTAGGDGRQQEGRRQQEKNGQPDGMGVSSKFPETHLTIIDGGMVDTLPAWV